jgi:hypothetical protein
MKEGEIPIQFNEIGDYFYVIISGKVGINIPNQQIKFWSDKY